ncbi:MAG: glycosyltransferase [Candidatus Methylomirabilales bacterium]
MSPVVVVHLVEDLRRGGLETVVRDIVTGLDGSRFSPQVWCLTGGGAVAEEIAAAGLPVRIFELVGRPSAGFLFHLAGQLRKAGAAILHCHGYPAATPGRVAAILARTPRVYAHVHTLEQYSARQRCLVRLLSAFTTRVICISESVRATVIAAGVPPARTQVIYNGVDEPSLPARAAGRARFGITPDARVVGCVAALAPHKGQAILIDAVAAISRTLPDIVLLLVGDGPMRPGLEARARAAGMAAVFAGQVDRVGPALAAMDVKALLSPSREGLSLALLEAMAAGKPLVAARVGGIAEVVQDGVNGLLCDPGDAETAARCLLRVLTDPPLAARLGAAGRQRYLETFTRTRMLTDIEALYGG